jgi:hypothetical protein
VLDLDVDGVIINFAHGIPVASGFYRATAGDQEAIWPALTGKDGKAPSRLLLPLTITSLCTSNTPAITSLSPRPGSPRRATCARTAHTGCCPTSAHLIIHVDPDLKCAGYDPIYVEKRTVSAAAPVSTRVLIIASKLLRLTREGAMVVAYRLIDGEDDRANSIFSSCVLKACNLLGPLGLINTSGCQIFLMQIGHDLVICHPIPSSTKNPGP